jgi:hypothetical protein
MNLLFAACDRFNLRPTPGKPILGAGYGFTGTD